MNNKSLYTRIHPVWWSAFLVGVVIVAVLLSAGLFAGTFRKFVPVTLT